jgi:hypothetical protein
METRLPSENYIPPDPAEIDNDPIALDFWARSLNVRQEALRQAVERVGPALETVKQELGIGGVG